MTTPAVRLEGVTMRYGGKRGRPGRVALNEVSLDVAEGETHGLLGPNGAGKSTMVKIISTLLVPTGGRAEVLGREVTAHPHEIRSQVGVVFGGERGLYGRVSARQNLEFWCALYRMDRRRTKARCDELLERVGLLDRADEPVERFSRGMKQRVHLARGLVHDPRLLFLDEPTSGMDPSAAHGLRALIKELQAEGRTIFLATHDMVEAEVLCDRVSLLDRGTLMLTAEPAEVSRTVGGTECVDFTTEDQELIAALTRAPHVRDVTRREGRSEWRAFPVSEEATRDVLLWLVERNVLSARTNRPSLEEVYLRLVGDRGLSV